MYDQSLGSAMNYGNIGPRRRRGGYQQWLDNEQELYPDQQQQDAAPVQQPPLKRALLRGQPSLDQSERPMNNYRPAGPRAVDNSEKLRTPSAPTGYQARYFTPTGDMKQDITSAYQTMLGREPDAEGLAAHMKNPGGLRGVMDTLYNSPEYAQYQQSQQQTGSPQTSVDDAGGFNEKTAPPNPLQAALAPREGWGFTSRTGGDGRFQYTPMTMGDTSQFQGFNFENRSERDLNSLKYIFAQAASNVDVTQNDAIDKVVANLNQMGVPAKKVGPDSIDFGLGEGPMDVILGGNPAAGIENVAWQWIPAAGASPGGMAQGFQQQALGALNPLQSAIGGGENNMLAQILAILQQQLGPKG